MTTENENKPQFDLNKHTFKLLQSEPFFAGLSRRHACVWPLDASHLKAAIHWSLAASESHSTSKVRFVATIDMHLDLFAAEKNDRRSR